MKFQRSLLSALMMGAAGCVVVQAQSFTKTDLGCVPGHSGPDCPKQWRFEGGPGFVGHRTEWQTNGSYETKIMCSPSCVGSANPQTCSLIMVFHGIHSNPADMIWLMLGSDLVANGETFAEDEAHGGPFCISFHKSESAPWDYTCDGNDAAHIEGFIHWALAEFPSLDPDAVNLHGFSSGGIQINNVMNTGCPIEGLVSAAAPYGSGNVWSPPTTKAAYLIGHGTHDNIVQYQAVWDPSTSTSVPSCACDWGNGDATACFFQNFLHLFGESLAGGIASLRGYAGGAFGTTPPVIETLDLIDADVTACESKKAKCLSALASPNPFNDGYDCPSLPARETDVIDYPVSEPGAGSVRLLRMNLHNHDYPNRRRSPWGPVEYFFVLRKFFNENRGRAGAPPVTRVAQQASTGRLCNNPKYDAEGPDHIYRAKFYASNTPGFSKEWCRARCEAEHECVEAFYMDFAPYYPDKACNLQYGPNKCLETYYAGLDAVHWTVTETNNAPTPTSQPSKPPIPSPTEKPTPSPTLAPNPAPATMCTAPEELIPGLEAGYSCQGGSMSGSDSNEGGDVTQANCEAGGGTWTPYDCGTAEAYWLTLPAGDTKNYLKDEWWEPVCCWTDALSFGLCTTPSEELNPVTLAGYSCQGGSLTGRDSNEGGDVTQANCEAGGGTWTPYTCADAEAYWKPLPQDSTKSFLRDDWWEPICCEPAAPLTPAPTSGPTISAPPTPQDFCPEECAVPTCHWNGVDGPGWDPTWTGDEDGTPTVNGFCTTYCSPEYAPGKRLCGTSAWHVGGIDCSRCAAVASNPIVPPSQRDPSSGLCAQTEALSGHALWGSGVRECAAGPNPTGPDQCTVYQAMNGDAVTNPLRTCDSFCTSFGLTCIDGFDDGNDGCTYGGEGIGCFSELGCCSEGGPTPDHVCVCGPGSTPAPTDGPTMIPTGLPTASPSITPSVEPTTASPTTSPTAKPSSGPTAAPNTEPTSSPTAKPSAKPTSGPSVTPSTEPTKNPTNSPVLNPTTDSPTNNPTEKPTGSPVTTSPTKSPTNEPTGSPVTTTPSETPTKKPTTGSPTKNPTMNPTKLPTKFPTLLPTKSPTKTPTTSPTDSPVGPPPSLDLCPSSSILLKGYHAGFSCLDNLGDSNVGTTEADCNAMGGTWVPYKCSDADAYWRAVGGLAWEFGEVFQGPWSLQCCHPDPSSALTETVDIGSPGIPGGSTYSSDSGVVTLYAGGADIWGTSDSFRYAYRTMTGDGVVWARVSKPAITDYWVKAGIMVRESLAPTSRNAAMFYTGHLGVLTQFRSSPGAETSATHLDYADRAAPIFMAIVRVGNNFEYYKSEDGSDGSYVKLGGTVNVPMGPTVYIGVAATAHNNGLLTTAAYEYFGYDNW